MGYIKRVLSQTRNSGITHYILAGIIIGAVAFICTPLSNTQNYHVVSFLLLFVVSILSTLFGVGPVLFASTLSAIVWNYFFIPPHHTFNIEKTEDILIFGLFFIIAITNGVLTTRVRKQEKITRDREKNTNALFQLTKELSKSSSIEEILDVAIREIKRHFSIDPVFILQDGNGRLDFTGMTGRVTVLSEEDYKIAVRAFDQLNSGGAAFPPPFSSGLAFYPLLGAKLNPGLVAVKRDSLFLDEQKYFWDTFITQISNALEREFLGKLARKVRFLDESDRLYRTLFNSISHEFRIPVATIMGASDSILNSSASDSIQKALCNEIFTASLRLNRLVENLLNISRLESGHISVRPDWCDINDLLNKVTEDLKEELKPFTFKVSVEEDMPLVKIDFGLMEQVLYNLIVNSTQYAPALAEINLISSYKNGRLILEVIDRGPGFPETDVKNVFKKFFRADGSKSGGLGLGLSIAKGFVEAHNGLIKAENMNGGGAKVTIHIPSGRPHIENFENNQDG